MDQPVSESPVRPLSTTEEAEVYIKAYEYAAALDGKGEIGTASLIRELVDKLKARSSVGGGCSLCSRDHEADCDLAFATCTCTRQPTATRQEAHAPAPERQDLSESARRALYQGLDGIYESVAVEPTGASGDTLRALVAPDKADDDGTA